MAPKHREIRISETKQDFFANLPLDIMIEILSRLPIPTVMRCKRLRKSWLDLIESPEFAKSHVSKSVRSLALDEDRPLTLALFRGDTFSKPYEILEVVDSQDSGHHCNVVFKFNFSLQKLIIPHCSANGLLLMSKKLIRDVFICNPITREYMKLPPLSPPPPKEVSSFEHIQDNAFGFGVSKLTGKYKVVRIFKDSCVDQFKCEIYTLGTGSWRSAAAPAGPILSSITSLGFFFNGNIHWLFPCFGGESSARIACFDLETECFSTFSIPHDGRPYFFGVRALCALGDSLCLSCKFVGVDVDIWLMNKYGDDKSWRKTFIIRNTSHSGIIVPIKMFKNGDIMFASQQRPKLYCYSSKTRTTREVDQTKGFTDYGFKPSSMTQAFFHSKPSQWRM